MIILLFTSLSLMVMAILLYPGFSFKTHWISNLGERGAKSRFFYSISIVNLALLGYSLNQAISNSYSIYNLGYLVFILGLLSLLIVLMVPVNACKVLHEIIAVVMFVLVCVGMLIASYYVPSPILLVIALLIVVNQLLIARNGVILYKKFGEIPINLVEKRNRVKDLFARNSTIAEWTLLVLVYIWIITVITVL